LIDGWGEFVQVIFFGDFQQAELLEVGVGELDIAKAKVMCAQVFDEVDETHLRCVGTCGKHGFAEESSTDREAIESADEFHTAAILMWLPCFNAVGISHVCELAIHADDLGADPRLVIARSRLGACGDDAGKCAVACDDEIVSRDYFCQ